MTSRFFDDQSPSWQNKYETIQNLEDVTPSSMVLWCIFLRHSNKLCRSWALAGSLLLIENSICWIVWICFFLRNWQKRGANVAPGPAADRIISYNIDNIHFTSFTSSIHSCQHWKIKHGFPGISHSPFISRQNRLSWTSRPLCGPARKLSCTIRPGGPGACQRSKAWGKATGSSWGLVQEDAPTSCQECPKYPKMMINQWILGSNRPRNREKQGETLKWRLCSISSRRFLDS